MTVTRYDAIVGEQIVLNIAFRYDATGELFDPYEISKVEMLDQDTQTILETITSITKLETGKYQITTSSSWNDQTRTALDKWYFKITATSETMTASESTVINSVSVSTQIEEYITKLRRRVHDTDSNRYLYSDETLRNYIIDAVDELCTSMWYIKFEYVGNKIVKKSDGVTEPTDPQVSIILLQAEILIKYSEISKYSRESIMVKDIRGTIDTTSITKQLKTAIDKLENRLSSSIKTNNRSKNRGMITPKRIDLQSYNPTGVVKEVTFKTKYNITGG